MPFPKPLTPTFIVGVGSTSSLYVAVCSCVGAFPPELLPWHSSYHSLSLSREAFGSRCQIEWKAANQTMAFDIRYPIFTLLTLPPGGSVTLHENGWKIVCWLVCLWWFNPVSSSEPVPNVISTLTIDFHPPISTAHIWPRFKRHRVGNLASHQFYQFQFRPISANRLKNKSALWYRNISCLFLWALEICIEVHKQLQTASANLGIVSKLTRNRLFCCRNYILWWC